MAIDIGSVLTRAFQTVSKYRVLWVLGFIVALLAGTGGNNINFNVNGNEPVRVFNVDVPFSAGLVAGLAALVLLLGIVLFVLRSAFDAGLISAGDDSSRATPPNFREAWAASKRGMWPVLVLNLILIAFALLLVLGAALWLGLTIGGAVLLGVLGGRLDNQLPELVNAWPAIGLGLFGVLVLLLVAVPIGFMLSVTTQIAQRAAVLDHQPIGQAWSTGWHTARTNLGNCILIVLAQFIVNLVVGLVVAAIILPIVGIPVVALAVGNAPVDWALGSLLVALVLLAWLLRGAALALPTAWNSLVWTLFYRAVTVGAVQTPGPAIYGGRLPPTVPGGYSR